MQTAAFNVRRPGQGSPEGCDALVGAGVVVVAAIAGHLLVIDVVGLHDLAVGSVHGGEALLARIGDVGRTGRSTARRCGQRGVSRNGRVPRSPR
jgi:hypothetical protein